MKKHSIIVAMLLISITSSQINCMNAFTDPYGLNDEAQTPLQASIGTNTDNTNASDKTSNEIDVLVGIYIFHEGKILLCESDMNNQKYWRFPIRHVIPGEAALVTIKNFVKDLTGLDLYNLQAFPGFSEIPEKHIIILEFIALAPTDKLIYNDEFQWFNKHDLPHNIAPYMSKDFIYRNLR